MKKYCKVKECRFNNYHTTKNHICGKCKKNGHGLIECKNKLLKDNLIIYHDEKMDEEDRCKFIGCDNKDYHTTEGHHCEYCNDRLHSIFTCTKYNNDKYDEIVCPICKKNNKINKKQSKLFGYDELCIICMDKNKEIFFPECGHVCLCINCYNKVKINKIEDNILISFNKERIKSVLKEYPSYTHEYQGMGCYSILRRLNINSEIESLFIHSDDHYLEDIDDKIKKFTLGYILIN